MQKIIFKNNRGQTVSIGNSRPFILTDIEGLGGVETTLITTRSPNQDGVTHHNTILDGRPLVIKGGIVGKDKEDMFRKRRELSSTFNPKTNGVLTYKNNALERSIDCVVELGPAWGKQIKRMQEFMIQLYCPNPLLNGFEKSEEIAQWLGGLAFPLKLPTRFATKSTPKMNIVNEGDVETHINITVVGPTTNPKLINITTGEFIKINRTLTSSDRLYISTEFGNKKVIIKDNEGNETNVFNWIDLESTLFSLQVGDNVLEYTSDDEVDKARIFIKYKNRYVGV